MIPRKKKTKKYRNKPQIKLPRGPCSTAPKEGGKRKSYSAAAHSLRCPSLLPPDAGRSLIPRSSRAGCAPPVMLGAAMEEMCALGSTRLSRNKISLLQRARL